VSVLDVADGVPSRSGADLKLLAAEGDGVQRQDYSGWVSDLTRFSGKLRLLTGRMDYYPATCRTRLTQRLPFQRE
jgi:hypothetical protein